LTIKVLKSKKLKLVGGKRSKGFLGGPVTTSSSFFSFLGSSFFFGASFFFGSSFFLASFLRATTSKAFYVYLTLPKLSDQALFLATFSNHLVTLVRPFLIY